MKHAKYFNENDLRRISFGVNGIEDHSRSANKNGKLYQIPSVIEDGGDSFISGQELLQQFRQFGLETVVVEDDPFAQVHEKIDNIQQNHDHIEKKNSEIDNILDFSNLVRVKQKNNERHSNSLNIDQHINKLSNLTHNIKDLKNSMENLKDQTHTSLNSIKDYYENSYKHFVSYVKEKIIKIGRMHQNERQSLKGENQHLKTTNNELKNQVNRLKFIEAQTKIQRYEKQKQSKGLSVLSQNEKLNEQIQKQYEKHSKILRTLRKQIDELNREVESLTQENKNLKKIITQYQNMHNGKNPKSPGGEGKKIVQSYSIFLEKLRDLEQEINQIRSLQKQSLKQELQAQVIQQQRQIDKFLTACQMREQEIIFRERQIERKQKQLERRFSLQQQNTPTQFYIEGLKEQFNGKASMPYYTIGSPRRNKQAPPQQIFSERGFRMSRSPSPRSYVNQGELLRSLSGSKSKYSDQLNCRLMRIENSIANELNSLRYRV